MFELCKLYWEIKEVHRRWQNWVHAGVKSLENIYIRVSELKATHKS